MGSNTNILTLQPTSPFVKISTLKKAVNIFFKFKGTGIAPIAKINDSHPLTAQIIDSNHNLKFMVKPKNFDILFPRQNRPNAYRFTGGFYLRRSDNILNYKNDGWALGKKPLGIIIGEKESFDINTKMDLKLAKLLYEKTNLFEKNIHEDSIFKVKDISIGVGTRINGKILIHGKSKVKIGKFNAIGYGV